MLIACVKAENKSVIKIKNPSSTVSEPYIDATLRVLRYFDFTVHVSYDSRRRYTEFRVPPEQRGKSFRRGFRVPADMSSAAMIIGATLCSSGKVELPGIDFRLPQADSLVVDIAKRFGARIRWRRGALIVNVTGGINPDGNHLMQKLDLSGAPDLVPAVVGMACGLNHSVRVENVGHLRFKESDRLSTIVNGFRKLGVVMREGHDSIDIFGVSNISRRKPILLDPQNDHRMLMAFTIAGLSGRFVAFDILNPGCVKKSYPNFVSDIQGLCGNEGKKILRIGRALED